MLAQWPGLKLAFCTVYITSPFCDSNYGMKQRTIIAVDGLAGSGKSSLSKALAEKLDFTYLSTGLLYRAVGYLAIKAGLSLTDGPAIASLIAQHSIKLVKGADGSSRLLLDGSDLTIELAQPQFSEAASRSGLLPEVRSALIDAQRTAFPGESLVVEGRDIGTVIFPKAQFKFFIEVAQDERINRRIKQLHGDTSKFSPDELTRIKKEIEIEVLERDLRDSQRALAPTVPAADAILIDNSHLPLTQVVKNMYDFVANQQPK